MSLQNFYSSVRIRPVPTAPRHSTHHFLKWLVDRTGAPACSFILVALAALVSLLYRIPLLISSFLCLQFLFSFFSSYPCFGLRSYSFGTIDISSQSYSFLALSSFVLFTLSCFSLRLSALGLTQSSLKNRDEVSDSFRLQFRFITAVVSFVSLSVNSVSFINCVYVRVVLPPGVPPLVQEDDLQLSRPALVLGKMKVSVLKLNCGDPLAASKGAFLPIADSSSQSYRRWS